MRHTHNRGDCREDRRGSKPDVPPFVVFEPGLPAPRLVPTEPLGPWALASLERLLGAAEPGAPLMLDLVNAPVSQPMHVAAVLWADDVARELGVDLEVLVGDMASAELLDFAGVDAPVYLPGDARPEAPVEHDIRRASAY